MTNITIQNIIELSYDELAISIMPYYNIIPPHVMPSAEAEEFFYIIPQYYSYLTGLWSVLDHAVRDMDDKTQMSKRNLIEQAMHALKLTYEATSRRLTSKAMDAQLGGR